MISILPLWLSFISDPHFTFTWARIGLQLSAKSSDSDALCQGIIAHDVFPRQVLWEVGSDNSYLTPEIQFGLKAQKIENLPVNKSKEEFVFYQPKINAYGIKRSNVSWDFELSPQITESRRDLLSIIRTTKNCKPKANFLLAAEVEFHGEINILLPITVANSAYTTGKQNEGSPQ